MGWTVISMSNNFRYVRRSIRYILFMLNRRIYVAEYCVDLYCMVLHHRAIAYLHVSSIHAAYTIQHACTSSTVQFVHLVICSFVCSYMFIRSVWRFVRPTILPDSTSRVSNFATCSGQSLIKRMDILNRLGFGFWTFRLCIVCISCGSGQRSVPITCWLQMGENKPQTREGLTHFPSPKSLIKQRSQAQAMQQSWLSSGPAGLLPPGSVCTWAKGRIKKLDGTWTQLLLFYAFLHMIYNRSH